MTNHFTRSVLLAPFVSAMVLVTGCVPHEQYDTLESQYNSLFAQNSANTQDIASLKQHVSAQDEHISRLQNAIAYTVNTDLLFRPGSWQMSESGKKIMAKLASQIVPFSTQKIVVNGYTDNEPVGPALRKRGITSNQELSQKRAEEVMNFLISQGAKPDLVTARGFGDQQPVAPNTTAAGRAQNRRVEILPAG
jgi:chemotaxis protein MotB